MHATQIFDRPSPNCGARNHRGPVSYMIIHYTGMRTAQEALDRLCDPDAKVSAHYLIDEQGQVTRLVDETMRAWHAGLSYWRGERDMNSVSIGIELVNPGHEFGYRPFPAAQMAALIALAQDITARHAIARDCVLGHSDVAPDRKMDPGELFDWPLLARSGLGAWTDDPDPAYAGCSPLVKGDDGPDVLDLRHQLATWGYDVAGSGVYDEKLLQVVTAFQRHWRPKRVDGVADAQTRGIVAALNGWYRQEKPRGV